MRESLHAASSDDDARDLVRTGTLTTPLRPVGLGPIPAAVAGARGLGATRPPRDAKAKRRAAEQAAMLKAAKASEAALRREVDAATRALDRAEVGYARAREAADVAAERAQEARRRVREARAALTDAERRRDELEREA
jgi:hypothetical protein